MKHWPEIIQLEELLKIHEIRMSRSEAAGFREQAGSICVLAQISGKDYTFYLEDEYADWHEENPPLCLQLIFMELEEYADADDYLVWCRQRFYDVPREDIRQYHMRLRDTYQALEQVFGRIEAPISDWDFQMNAAAARALRDRNPA